MDVFADEYCEDLRVAVSHLIGVSLPMEAKILTNASASSHGRTVEMYRFWFRETALLGGDEENRSIRFVDLSMRLYDVDMPCAPRFFLFGEKARLSYSIQFDLVFLHLIMAATPHLMSWPARKPQTIRFINQPATY
jgi:hypothetical protein